MTTLVGVNAGMNRNTFEAHHEGQIFRIEEDFREVGAYLYVYEGHVCVRDYLQNDIEACMKLALDEYSVPLAAWAQKEEA